MSSGLRYGTPGWVRLPAQVLFAHLLGMSELLVGAKSGRLYGCTRLYTKVSGLSR